METYAPGREALTTVTAAMSAELDSVAAEMTDAVHSSVPELGDDMRAGTHSSCRANIGMLLDMLTEGAEPQAARPPAEALTYAREYARRGHGFELLQRAYRAAQARFLRLLLDRLRAEIDSADELAETFGFCNEWVFSFVEALESPLTEDYMRERERSLRGTVAMRAEEVRSILDGRPVDRPTASSRLRYELDRRHVAFVVWARDGDLDRVGGSSLYECMERVAAEVAELLGAGDYLAVPLGGRLACWAGLRRAPELAELPHRLSSAAECGLNVAVGQCTRGIDGFRRSHAEAMRAERVVASAGHPAGGCWRFSELALDALLIADREEAQRFVRDELGALGEADDAAGRLRATLEVFLDEHASYLHAARRLGVHENTVSYRVRRAEELLGRGVKDRPLELRVALRLATLTSD